MADIDPYQIAGIVMGAIIPLVAVIVANGYYARKFEKRKKKYEVKLERYSAVADCLHLIIVVDRAMDSFEILRERVSKKGFSRAMREPDTSNIELDALGSLRYLEDSLGLDVSEEPHDLMSWEVYLGVKTEEMDSISEEEATERAQRWMGRCVGSVVRCTDVLTTRLNRGLSDIKVIGQKPIAEKVEKLVDPILGQSSKDRRRQLVEAKWRSTVDTTIGILAEDLEKTL